MDTADESWSLYFDGSDVGLPHASKDIDAISFTDVVLKQLQEDVWGSWVDATTSAHGL